MPDTFCAYCFGPIYHGDCIEGKHGRQYHPGCEKADKKLPQSMTTAEGVEVGGRGAKVAAILNEGMTEAAWSVDDAAAYNQRRAGL